MCPTLTIRQLRLELTGVLSRAGIAEPGREVLDLMVHQLDLPATRLYAESDQPVTAAAAAHLRELVLRRKQHEPLAYLLGHVWFDGLSFAIGPDVLVPRPDSEVLVETAQRIVMADVTAGQTLPVRILDTCTGSGCIGISLTKRLKEAGFPVELILVDLSETALMWAKHNATLHLPEQPVTLCCADLFPTVIMDPVDLITANPPYIESEIIAGLMPEVSRYEPLLALDGGQDGLAFYRRLATEARRCLKSGGWLVLEHGYSQAEAVSGILIAEHYETWPTQYDFGANPRVCAGRL